MTLLIVLAFTGCVEDNTEKDTEDGNGETSGDVVATVNGEEINSDDVADYQQQYSQQGQEISEEDALEGLIDQEVLNQEAQEYIPSDNEALKDLESMLGETNLTTEKAEEILTQYGMDFEQLKEQIAVQDYLEITLEKEEFNVTDEEAEAELETMLQQQGQTLEEFKEQLEQQGMSYEDQLQSYKQQMAQQKLIQQLREDAEIIYL